MEYSSDEFILIGDLNNRNEKIRSKSLSKGPQAREPLSTVFVLLGLILIVTISSIVIGSSFLTVENAVFALFGEGTRGAVLLVQKIRLPRIVAGLLVGAALGAAGCLTQTLARNRLATPDLLGVNDGATLAVMLLLMGSTTGMIESWWGGPLGAVLTALVLVVTAGGLGSQGYRVLIVGLAVSNLIRSSSELMLSKENLQHASAVYTWSIGSLVGTRYSVAVPVAIGLIFILPLALFAGRQLNLLRFHEDMATSLGVNVPLARVFILSMAVALAGLAVGMGGPIGFVALAAPILISHFVGPSHIPILSSALLGAVLVVVADAVGRVVAAPVEIPVGVITSVLGGPFLLWVLLKDSSKKKF